MEDAVSAADNPVSIALGLNPLARAGGFVISRSGFNSSISPGTVPEDIWGGGGLYTGFPSGDPETVQVFSSSANDTANGSGARVVRVTGLDENWNIVTENVILNGTAPVTTTKLFRRVNRLLVISSGDDNTAFNAGIIQCRHSVTQGNVFASMGVGLNATLNGGYTIPDNHIGLLMTMIVSIRGGASAAVDGFIWNREQGLAPFLRRPFSASSQAQFIDADLHGTIGFPPRCDLMPRVTQCTGTGVEVTSNMQLLVVPLAALDYFN